MRGGRWRLNDAQRLVIALTVVTAVFLAAMAWGMGNPALLLVAVLLLVLVALGIFLLGLRYSGRSMVQGTAYVAEASAPPVGAIVGRCDMRLQVNLPAGQTTVRFRDPSVPVVKWPRPGSTLPVEMDTRNARSLRVRWELAEQTLRPTSPATTSTATPTSDAGEPVVTTAYFAYADGIDEPEYSPTPAGPALVMTDSVTGFPSDDRALPSNPISPAPISPAPAGPDWLAPDWASADWGPFDQADPDLDGDGDATDAPVSPPEGGHDGETGPPAGSVHGDAAGRARAAGYEIPARGVVPHPRGADVPVSPAAPPAAPGPPTTKPATTGPPTTGPAAMGMMLIVSDLDRSVAFYRDLLGFEVADNPSGGAVLAHGAARILLRQVADMSPVDRRLQHLHVPVPRLNEAYQDLRARGVEFVHQPRMLTRGEKLELWAATFRDPDGHAIALTEWRDRPPA